MLLIASIVAVSCAGPKIVTVEKTVEKTVTVRDTVIDVKIEKEYVEKEMPVKDTTSRLETSVAESAASISDGVLKHSLKNKPIVKAEVPAKTERIYVSTPVPYEVVKEVPFIPGWVWISLAGNAVWIVGLVLRIRKKVLF